MTTPPFDPDQPTPEAVPAGDATSAPDAGADTPVAEPGKDAPEPVAPEALAAVGPQDVVPGPPVASPSRSRRGWIIGGVVAVVLAVLAAGGIAAFAFISGGGTQPEDVVPADAVAFVKIDLDPAAGQKVALARLATRFDLGAQAASSEDQEPSQILSDVLQQATGVEVDYARDIEPWIGSRAAVAIIAPDSGDLDAAKPLVVVASTDDSAAQASLERLFPASSGYAVDVRDGFALIGAPADVAVPGETLSSVSAFTQAEAAIGDNVVLGYVDIDGILEAADKVGADLPEVTLPEVASPIGRRAAAFGVVAEPDAIALRGHVYGLTEASAAAADAPLVLNENTVALLGIRGLSDTVSQALKEAGADSGVASLIDVEQFTAALGDLAEVQVAIDEGEPVIQGTVVTSDIAATEAFWQSLGALGGLSVTSSGNAVTISEPGAGAAFGPQGDLGAVTSVLPDAATANLVLWADVNALEASSAGDDFDAEVRELKALGVSLSTATVGDAEFLAVAQFD